MNQRMIFPVLLICLICLVMMTGCAQPNSAVGTPGANGVAGFWAGLWQGLILPVTVIVSLFDDSVGIYEIHNSGNFYNVGFAIGASIMFGSVLASKQKR
ncbi:MAG: hypothetical protein ACYCXF_07250 [Thermoleophilia bacterium]